MEKKLTPYQKLKKQVSTLKKQLDIVCNDPDTLEAMGIRVSWKIMRKVENEMMKGNPNPTTTQK